MAGEIAGPKVLQCTSCGASLIVRAQGSSLVVACGHCGAVLDANSADYKILSQNRQKLGLVPSIPIGVRGKLRGETWEVIGFMERKDGGTDFSWREYLLFNPRQGFRWLVESNGHWSLVKTLTNRPKTDSFHTYLDGQMFTRFEQGTAVVTCVVGEFYWRVKVGDTADVADYIHPPQILSYERSSGEIVWSLGDYVEAYEITAAFGAAGQLRLPPRIGVGANQPGPDTSKESLQTAWAFAALALFLAFGLSLASAPSEVSFSQTYDARGALGVPVTSPSFDLGHGTTNAELSLHSGVSNDWLEIEGELVGETNDFSEEFELGVEYYSGYDSDGSWSEGSTRNTFFFSSVPAGRYHLSLKPVGAANLYDVAVTRGVSMWSNFFVALFLISLYPGFLLLRARRFELARWSNSDYSPSGAPAPAGGDD